MDDFAGLRYMKVMGANAKLYDRDFYAWTFEQAALLREGRFGELDLVNVVEEIESMGKSEKRELDSRLVILLLHLTKWRFQPEMRGRSWRLSVEAQRADLGKLLNQNPSLRPTLSEAVLEAWPRSLLDARRETGLDAAAFPADCPWTPEQALDDDFWPA